MTPIDLSKTLSKFKSGWVAIDKKNYQVVAHTTSFEKINDKTKDSRNLILMPVSKNYFGFVTANNV